MSYLKISVVLLLLFFFACEEETVILQQAADFGIQEVNLPAVISTTSSKPVLLTARITHPSGNAGVDSVVIQFQDSVGSVRQMFEMLDDGENQGSGSGDVIAFDQVYSRKVVGTDLLLPPGRYQAVVFAYAAGGERLQSVSSQIDLFPNQIPEIVSFLFPDTVFSGMAATDVLITVNDDDGLDDIRWAVIQGFEPGSSQPVFQDTIFNPMNNSPVFTVVIDSAYGAGKAGAYDLRCFAEDRVGEQSVPAEQPTCIENTVPLVYNENVPDTLTLPALGNISVEITVEVKDGQSLADVDSVYFNSYLPGGNPSSGNPFLMFDNGLPFDPQNPVAVGDQVAGDGIYTLTIFLPSTASPGEYRFEFFGRDRVGNLGTGPVATIVVE